MAFSHSLTDLPDQTLLDDLATLVARDRVTTAAMLAHLAEVDARRLYLQAGYPSMFAYCVQRLRLSEQSAFKRIRAARAARKFPIIFGAIADGRLNLSTVVLLKPFLNRENVQELAAAATHKTRTEVQQLIAEWFPQLDVPVLLYPVIESPAIAAVYPVIESDKAAAAAEKNAHQLSPGTVGDAGLSVTAAGSPAISGRTAKESIPKSHNNVVPIAPQRFVFQLTIDQDTRDKLVYAQALLSHKCHAGEAEVLDRALDALIAQLEKRKFAATQRPRQSQGREKLDVHDDANPHSRHIPFEVRRAVWARDGGQCTFVSHDGQRCSEREQLEFHHVVEFARGGRATVDGICLLCRAHNQYSAEQAFGIEFMKRKRKEARAHVVPCP